MKRSQRSILLSFFIFSTCLASAQESVYQSPPVAGMKNTKYIASVAMISDLELLKPVTMSFGTEVNAYFRILNKPKLKKASNASITERELFIKPTFGFIYRRRYHTGIFVIPSIAFRNTSPKGVFVELNLDAGYYYAKLNAPVYELQPDGTMEKVRGGFSNALLGAKFIAGFDLSKKYEIPLCLNAGAGIFYRYPNNQQWIRHVTLQAGISYIFRRAKE